MQAGDLRDDAEVLQQLAGLGISGLEVRLGPVDSLAVGNGLGDRIDQALRRIRRHQ